MKHFYVEGVVIPVSEEHANVMVAAGQWFKCKASQHNGISSEDTVVIYHKEARWKA